MIRSVASNTATKPSAQVDKKNLSCVSLFSGGGGLDLGLEAAGFSTVFASDVDSYSCATLQRGAKAAMKLGYPFLEDATIHCGDVRDLDSSFIEAATGIKPGEVDLLAGGPPCQAFSVFGKRQGTKDPRGGLVFEYIRLLAAIKPKSFVFENVYGLMTVEGGLVFEKTLEALAKPSSTLRYKLSVFRLNSSEYGVPQFRDRIFIIGSRDGVSVTEPPKICGDPAAADLKANGLFPYRTVKQAFSRIPSIGSASMYNHTGRKHSQRIIDRYAKMKHGERDSHTRINKLNPDRPSFTIIVGSDKGGGKGHIHPHEPREVSPRESARIQTFPDWWNFVGKVRHPIRQVGNAVPPLLGYAVGASILKEIFNQQPNDFKSALSYLDQEHLFPELKHV